MTDSGHSDEPLQQLPPGLPRRYAEYKPAPAAAATPPTNVGGYDELLAHCRSLGKELPRSKEGLAALDHLMDGHPDRAALAKLVRAIGMFYGDLLTHTVPGAHWIEEDSPCVRVTRTTAVFVVSVAERRLITGIPTLLQNYAHVLENALIGCAASRSRSRRGASQIQGKSLHGWAGQYVVLARHLAGSREFVDSKKSPRLRLAE